MQLAEGKVDLEVIPALEKARVHAKAAHKKATAAD